jgi:hypothetical protein
VIDPQLFGTPDTTGRLEYCEPTEIASVACHFDTHSELRVCLVLRPTEEIEKPIEPVIVLNYN